MGNKSSVATIHVSFDSGNVVSGSTVTGKAYLMVNQSSVSCVSVGSRVLGKENTQVQYTVTVRRGDKVHRETRTAHEQRNFMDQKFCLQHVPSAEILKGQYEYPFEFKIPNGAPATMSAHGGHGDHCNISYTMEVWLDRPGMMRWDIRHHMYVTVTNPPPKGNKIPLYIEPGRQPLHTCCCFHRGDVMMGGSADSSILSAGGQASVKYAISNHSTVHIKAVEVSISENVHFSARGHQGSANTTLYHRRLSPQEARLDLTPKLSQKLESDDGLNDLRLLSKMLESDTYKLDFSLPSSARNTYSGSIIRVEHRLTIKVITTFGTSNPTVWRHIHMFSADQQYNPHQSVKPTDLPALPVNWSPTVAEIVQLPDMALSSTPAAQEDDEENKPVSYTTGGGSQHGGKEVYHSFEEFVEAVKKTYDPCGELEKYIRDGNSIEVLTAEQLYALFKAVNDSFDQQRMADICADAMQDTTCVKVARAVAGSKEMCKREVAEKLLAAGPVLDKEENAHLLKSELSAFQYMTVEKYLK